MTRMTPSPVNLYNLFINGHIRTVLCEKSCKKYLKTVFDYASVDEYNIDVIPKCDDKIPLEAFANSYDLFVCNDHSVARYIYLMHRCKYVFVKDLKDTLSLPYRCLGDTFEGYLYINEFHSVQFKDSKLTVWEQTYVRDKPYRFYLEYLNLLKRLGCKCIVEIGSCRTEMRHDLHDINPMCCNDSHSTFYWCTTDAVVYTVDVNPICERVLNEARTQGRLNVSGRLKIYIDDGIRFLRGHKFTKKIDFLYLDAWDVSTDGSDTYAEKHLEAYETAKRHLNDICLIAIDDTDIAQGGKGKLAIPQMLKDNFIILMQGRQTLLYKGPAELLIGKENVSNER